MGAITALVAVTALALRTHTDNDTDRVLIVLAAGSLLFAIVAATWLPESARSVEAQTKSEQHLARLVELLEQQNASTLEAPQAPPPTRRSPLRLVALILFAFVAARALARR